LEKKKKENNKEKKIKIEGITDILNSFRRDTDPLAFELLHLD